jgi:Metal-dependent hydrolase
VHLQSSAIDPNVEDLDSEESKARLNQLKKTFKLQQSQAEKVQAHIANSPYKVIVSGDFNNTAYSYVYRIIRGDLNDSFEEAGNGFGRTFPFKYFPVRIDFILAHQSFEVNSFKTYDQKLSDHFPIYARFNVGSEIDKK